MRACLCTNIKNLRPAHTSRYTICLLSHLSPHFLGFEAFFLSFLPLLTSFLYLVNLFTNAFFVGNTYANILTYADSPSKKTAFVCFSGCYSSQYYVFPEFCARLLEHFTNKSDDLHLWAASCQSMMVPDDPKSWQSSGWERKYLTKPLRSPPTVTEEISNAVEITKDETVPGYTQRGAPFQTEGLPVHWIYHESRKHGFTRAEDCKICGEAVARFLHNDLRLGECVFFNFIFSLLHSLLCSNNFTSDYVFCFLVIEQNIFYLYIMG